MKPLKSTEYRNSRSILNPDRQYTSACKTDVAQTIARVRAELEAAKAAPQNVRTMRRAK